MGNDDSKEIPESFRASNEGFEERQKDETFGEKNLRNQNEVDSMDNRLKGQLKPRTRFGLLASEKVDFYS